MTKDDRDIVSDSLAYIHNKINEAAHFFTDAENTSGRLDSTWVVNAKKRGNDDLRDTLKMLNWLAKKYNITRTNAFTDTEVRELKIID